MLKYYQNNTFLVIYFKSMYLFIEKQTFFKQLNIFYKDTNIILQAAQI